MTTIVPPAADLSHAWLNTVCEVEVHGGTALHTLTTVRRPGAEDTAIRDRLDRGFVQGRPAAATIETVANTIFPRGLYRRPAFDWSPELDPVRVAEVDRAAEDLFSAYRLMLPLLLTAHGSSRGTYFSRMMNFPGRVEDGTNQLADRVKYLRAARTKGYSKSNVADVTLASGADGAAVTDEVEEAGSGLQTYSATDRRQRGFPCLVHVDLTVSRGELHLMAVYRHWYLLSKGYGNLVGLSRLLGFLSQQSGYPCGELVVMAGTADTERRDFGGARGLRRALDSAGALGPGTIL